MIMKMKTVVNLSCLAGVWLLAVGYATRAQQAPTEVLNRVGIISVTKILQNSQKHADHIKQSDAEAAKSDQALQTLQQDISAEQAQMQALVAGSDAYLAQLKVLINKQANYQAQKEISQQVLAAKDRQWMEQFYKEILKATDKVAEAKGLGMVFERTEPEFPISPPDRLPAIVNTYKVLYAKGCIDITDDVIAEIDK